MKFDSSLKFPRRTIFKPPVLDYSQGNDYQYEGRRKRRQSADYYEDDYSSDYSQSYEYAAAISDYGAPNPDSTLVDVENQQLVNGGTQAFGLACRSLLYFLSIV